MLFTHLLMVARVDHDDTNAGIQFGSKKVDEFGQARGLGTLFHEHGRI